MSKLDRISPTSLSGNPRATLRAWTKYEDLVLAAYRHHPKTYIYSPSNASPTTVASRVRDAIRGAIAFSYPISEPSITTNDLARWYSEIIVRHAGDKIYMGPITEIKSILSGVAEVTHSSNLIFDTLSFEEITAFCVLISAGRIPGPVEITHPPDISLLPARSNIHTFLNQSGHLIIL